MRNNARIPICCSRPGQMIPEFSSNFHKTSRALMCRVLVAQPDLSEIFFLLPAMVPPPQKKSRSHSEVPRNASVMLQSDRDSGCNTANAAECVPKTRVSTLHLRAPAAQGGSASVASHRGEQVISRSQCIRGVNRGP